MAETKRKRGQPSKFDSIDQEQVRLLATKGWTDADMATFFKVTPRTWHNWKKAHPDFFHTLNDWKAEADARVERSLFERATGFQHPEDKIFNADGSPLVVPTIKHYPPDSTAMIFWLKNRKPKQWRDQPAPDPDENTDDIFSAIAAEMRAQS